MRFTSVGIDENGKRGIPEDVLRELNKFIRDEVVEIEIKNDKITITRQSNRCALCGTKKNLKSFYNIKFICDNCIKTIREIGK